MPLKEKVSIRDWTGWLLHSQAKRNKGTKASLAGGHRLLDIFHLDRLPSKSSMTLILIPMEMYSECFITIIIFPHMSHSHL